MEEQGRAGRVKRWMPVMAVLVIIITGCFFILHKKKAYELQQNVYFMEWDNKEDETIFYRYNPENNVVTELGRIEGGLDFGHLVINKEETCITGLRYQSGIERMQYDLATGTVQSKDIKEKIISITESAGWKCVMLYDGGNKIIISYDEDTGKEKWLFYNFETDEYDIIDGGKYHAVDFIEIDDDYLWYMSDENVLYRFDLEMKTELKILDSIENAAVAICNGNVAYMKPGMQGKKLYQYDGKKSKCIVAGGWNLRYGSMLFDNESLWSDDGKQFFYIKNFYTIFGAANKSLMVYDTESGKSYCIYKEKSTLHYFNYIGTNG